MVFGSPSDGFWMAYLGIVLAIYFGGIRLALVALTIACFVWLFL
jgi:hypothetical protein